MKHIIEQYLDTLWYQFTHWRSEREEGRLTCSKSYLIGGYQNCIGMLKEMGYEIQILNCGMNRVHRVHKKKAR